MATDTSLRRFLQHVLPRGLQKVRYYGWMSSRQKQVLQKLKLLLGDVPCDDLVKKAEASRQFTCPKCGRPMQVVGVLAPVRPANLDDCGVNTSHFGGERQNLLFGAGGEKHPEWRINE